MTPNTQQLPLEDIIQPEAIDLWPPAIGWWVLVALILGLLLISIKLGRKLWQERQRRQQAYQLLEQAKQNYTSQANASNYCRDLNDLLKRYWRTYNTSPLILSSSGQDWVDLLNQQTPEPIFNERVADAFAYGPYRRISKLKPEILEEAVKNWLTSAKVAQLQQPLAGEAGGEGV